MPETAAAAAPAEVQVPNLKVLTRKQARERRFADVATINNKGIVHVNTKLTKGVRAAYGATLQRYNIGQDKESGTIYLIFTGMEDEEAYPITVEKSGKTFSATVKDALPDFNVVIPKGRIAEAPAEVVNVAGWGICLALKLTDLPMKAAPKRTPQQKKGKGAAQQHQVTQTAEQVAAAEQKPAGGSEEKPKT